ncbi:leucine-rich repeat-containing protein 71 [Falco peregrinus]|uniref:leucine-rich repeat-containing protein 71 n=1 Tax=Falco peregrinus TaxID=8954 RepID=UPI0024791BC0|nr:leucine-rich repeat-containing protein 71 [Falco peregrinus]
MRRRGERAPREKAAAEETKSPGRKAEQGAEEYCCSGILEQDFPELCTRAGMATVPKVTLRPSPSFPADEEPTEPTLVGVLARIERKYSYFQPCIQVEREPQDPRSTRAVFLRGWKMEEPMLGVLSQCLPTLAGLQAVHLWKVGLSERLLPVLLALLARCPRLRTLSLEGNPLPTPAFHTLMGSDSPLVHLSLRNNHIGDEDAQLIGKGLSTLSPSGRSLASLILSFNRISDLGAAYIARGLRLNRSLLFLSLENNDIGDVGATRLAEVLAPFALTHDEVVERRRLLLAEALGQSCTTPKETKGQSEDPSSAAPDKLPWAKHGKPPPKKKELLQKEEGRQRKKSPEPRAARGRDPKPRRQEKPNLEAPDPAELPHPLLAEAREHKGSVILPGNRALLNLNLAYNHVTERGLGAFLAALEEQQREKKPKVPGQEGLLCLSLEVSRVGRGAGTAVGLASPMACGGGIAVGWHHPWAHGSCYHRKGTTILFLSAPSLRHPSGNRIAKPPELLGRRLLLGRSPAKPPWTPQSDTEPLTYLLGAAGEVFGAE